MDIQMNAAALRPERIVCLTEEPTEVLYRLGAEDRVVGVSGFTVRPLRARKKPRVSSFLDANFEAIMDLRPDLVMGFSDLQADLARELIRRGVAVLIFNQRSVQEILVTIATIARIVDEGERGEELIALLLSELHELQAVGRRFAKRPRVFFEEWPDPLISGIRWVSELVEICGGEDIFARLRSEQGAAGRTVAAQDVIEANPDVIIGSWCGKKVKPHDIRKRAGWSSITAVAEDQIYEIKSSLILQPGPAALSDGARCMSQILETVSRGDVLPTVNPTTARQSTAAVHYE